MVLCASISSGMFRPPVASSVARLCVNGPKGSVLCILCVGTHSCTAVGVCLSGPVVFSYGMGWSGCQGTCTAEFTTMFTMWYHVSLGALGIGCMGGLHFLESLRPQGLVDITATTLHLVLWFIRRFGVTPGGWDFRVLRSACCRAGHNARAFFMANR